MKIWELDSDVNEFKSIREKAGEEIDTIDTVIFDGRSLLNEWKRTKFEGQQDDAGLKRVFGDNAFWSAGKPVFSQNAINNLKDLIDGNTEILPIDLIEMDYSIINVVKVLDCIDYDRAEVDRFPTSGRVSKFIKYAFKQEVVKNQHIFKIVEWPKSSIYVSDDFKKRVEETGLTNFKFDLVWDSKK